PARVQPPGGVLDAAGARFEADPDGSDLGLSGRRDRELATEGLLPAPEHPQVADDHHALVLEELRPVRSRSRPRAVACRRDRTALGARTHASSPLNDRPEIPA